MPFAPAANWWMIIGVEPEMNIIKAVKNAKFPWNMVKNCIKNVNYFRNFRIFCKKKTEIYM